MINIFLYRQQHCNLASGSAFVSALLHFTFRKYAAIMMHTLNLPGSTWLYTLLTKRCNVQKSLSNKVFIVFHLSTSKATVLFIY